MFLGQFLQPVAVDRKRRHNRIKKGCEKMKTQVRPVVITVHGIRTRGEWQKRIAPKIAQYGMIPVLLDYGYFNLFQFLMPWSRNKLVKWLRDEVSAVQRDYPEAPISVVAHSLGTYLIARLLEEESGITFETVLLAGSIISRDYDWKRLLNANRVKYVATRIDNIRAVSRHARRLQRTSPL